MPNKIRALQFWKSLFKSQQPDDVAGSVASVTMNSGSNMHDLWRRCQASIFSLTFEDAQGRISSGSGFKVGEFLVTNNHVIQVHTACKTTLRSVEIDGHTTGVNLSFAYHTFHSFLVEGDPETAWDFALLRIPDDVFLTAPSLDLMDGDEVEIGRQIAIFGYQFDQPHLSMHMGYLASQYQKSGVHYLQLDSSVNNGNSGGPLIDVRTGRVLGIVTRKETGLTQQFHDLQKSFQQNIAQLQEMQGSGVKVFAAGLDPVAAMLVSQVQMQRIAQAIGRSANVGIGFAYHIRQVRSSLSRQSAE
jgi:S1-C subfamily serine protease